MASSVHAVPGSTITPVDPSPDTDDQAPDDFLPPPAWAQRNAKLYQAGATGKFAMGDAIARACARKLITPTDAWVLTRAVDHWTRAGLTNCWPKRATAAADAGVSVWTWRNAIAHGVRAGLCRLHPRQYAEGNHTQATTLIQWCVPPGFDAPSDPGFIGPIDESKRKIAVRPVAAKSRPRLGLVP